MKQRLFQQRLEGEMLVDPGRFSNLSNFTKTATMMKRE
jgi:hypothetical protein